MIKYSLPGMYELKDLNMLFLELKRKRPEYFFDNIEIEAVYGNPQFCIWDGGRIFKDYNAANREELERIIDIYNNIYNLPIRYVFTNSILKKENYYNRFGNILMEVASNYNNEVVLADDNFMLYLKDKYPNFSFISSTTKCIMNKQEVKNELAKEDYAKVCLDYNFNKNIDFLKSFTEIEKSKTELLINPICGAYCPHRKNHYYLNSISHLNYGKKYAMEGCVIKHDSFSKEINENNLYYEDLVNIYEPMGFEHFKIEGRTWSNIDLLLTYCNYMIKPEYRNVVISFLSHDLENGNVI